MPGDCASIRSTRLSRISLSGAFAARRCRILFCPRLNSSCFFFSASDLKRLVSRRGSFCVLFAVSSGISVFSKSSIDWPIVSQDYQDLQDEQDVINPVNKARFGLRCHAMTRTIPLLCLVLSLPLLIQAAPVVAFVDVNVIPMDKERILPHQTVIVRNGTIAEIGDAKRIKVPKDA